MRTTFVQEEKMSGCEGSDGCIIARFLSLNLSFFGISHIKNILEAESIDFDLVNLCYRA